MCRICRRPSQRKTTLEYKRENWGRIIGSLQGRAFVPEREAAVRALQSGIQGAEEEPREILRLFASGKTQQALLRIGIRLPIFRENEPEKRKCRK